MARQHSYKLNVDEDGFLVGVSEIADSLDDYYDETDLGNFQDPFAELVYIILSVRTAEKIYQQAYANLVEFLGGDWSGLLESTVAEVAENIAAGGLAEKKAEQLLLIANTLATEDGYIDVGFFQSMNTNDLIDHLCSYKGIGVKVAKCIAMYALERPTFPIDIHCARVGERIGWYEKRTRYTRRYADLIDDAIPATYRHRLHVNLIQHGRELCTASSPCCELCPISTHCVVGLQNHNG